MISSYNVDICEVIEEVGYRFEVVDLSLKKKDLSYLIDEELYESTINQIIFLEKQKLPETVSENIESSDYNAVNLYLDVLESLLTDVGGNDVDLTRAAIYKYQHIKGLLNRMVGGVEHESVVSEVPHILNYMYDIVKKETKDDSSVNSKADFSSIVV